MEEDAGRLWVAHSVIFFDNQCRLVRRVSMYQNIYVGLHDSTVPHSRNWGKLYKVVRIEERSLIKNRNGRGPSVEHEGLYRKKRRNWMSHHEKTFANFEIRRNGVYLLRSIRIFNNKVYKDRKVISSRLMLYKPLLLFHYEVTGVLFCRL